LFLICSIKLKFIVLNIITYLFVFYYLFLTFQFIPFYFDLSPLLNYTTIITNVNKQNKDFCELEQRISENDILNPWYVSGFSDGDSSFWFSLVPNKKLKIGLN